ncbi:MAG: hypothetical protein AB7P52_17455 [Alphaproteobacteria bacterium]
MGPPNAPLSIDPEPTPGAFGQARARLTELLIRTCLIESYHSFLAHGKPYPFPPPKSLKPGVSAAAIEHPFQRPALVFLVDGQVPAGLNKHIRMRRRNEVSAGNLARLAPYFDHALFRLAALTLDAPGFDPLFAALLRFDYALVMQMEAPARYALTHMHVKVERLTDNALGEFGRSLGYIERRLFERGEAYVEAIEAKYYEYFGFPPNASGRRTAAAMAAQLMAARGIGFAIFASCQEDCRLTMIDDGDGIEHTVLALLPERTLTQRLKGVSLDRYRVAGHGKDQVVVIHRSRFRRTEEARPPAQATSRYRPDAHLGLDRPWLALESEEVLPLPGEAAPTIPYPRGIG